MQHATPHPWCIRADSCDVFIDKHLLEDTISPTPSPSLRKRQRASPHEDGMSKFTASCSDVLTIARTNFSSVNVVNLGVAHMLPGALSNAARAPLCRQMEGFRVYLGKNANPIVFHLSGMRVCQRDTPVPTEGTTSLRPSPSLRPSSPPRDLPASDHEDGFTK